MKKLWIVLTLILFSCVAAGAQTTHYPCNASQGAAFSGPGTFVNWRCDSYTSNGNNANTVSGATSRLPQVGDWVIGFLGHCVTTAVATACPAISGTNGAMQLTDSLGNAAAGQVTTNGQDVYWYSGQWFSMIGNNLGHCSWVGSHITINGTLYTVSQCITLTHLRLTGSAGVQSTPVNYQASLPGGADLTVGYCCAQTVGWYEIQNGGVSDTETSTACAVFTNGACTTLAAATSAMSFSTVEIANVNGFGSLDITSCAGQQLNCMGQFGATGASSPFPAQTQVNLQANGELVLFGGNYGSPGAAPSAPSGWTGLIVGSLSNTVAIQGQAFDGAGTVTLAQNQANSEDEYTINSIGITPAGTGGGGVGFPSIGIVNSICGFGGSARPSCVSGTTPMLFGNPLTPGSTVFVIHFNSTSGSGNTVSDSAGLFTSSGSGSNNDCGSMYIPYSGSTVFLKCWVAENISSSLIEDTFTVSPYTGADTWLAFEMVGLNNPALKDQNASNPNATSNISTGAVLAALSAITTTKPDLVLGCFGAFNGPFSLIQLGWINIDPFMGPNCEFEVQTSPGSVNPPQVDQSTNDAYAGWAYGAFPLTQAQINYFVGAIR